MRFQKAKLLIALMALLAGIAVVGRLTWFVVIGKKTILNPAAGHQPVDAVTKWWEETRRKIWGDDANISTPTERTKIEAYAVIKDANVSGSEPPKKEEVRVEAPVATGPEPYPHFAEVSILCLPIGDDEHRQDDQVWVSFEVKQPRSNLGEDGRQLVGTYHVGETLKPFPEIRVESIDAARSRISFRMPKHRDPRGLYEGYKGIEADSQIVEREVVPPSLDSALLSTGNQANLTAALDAQRRSAAKARLQALDREAPVKTEETYPGSGVWALGSEDLDSLAEDYDERLRQDVNVTSYNKNGVVGVQIQRIDEKSVFFSRGLNQNDVVLAVNDHPIPTLSEAVRYVRKNPERNFYEVKVLRNGRERILTYHVPR